MIRALSILLLSIAFAPAAVFTAANTSVGAVSNALFRCSNGDTVEIPAGTASWTNGLYVAKAVTIRGAGRGLTIISNASPGTQVDTHYRPVFYFNLLPNVATSYFGGLTIAGDPSQPANLFSAGVMVEGNNADGRRMCITNVHWTNLHCNSLVIESALGVVARSQFDVEVISIYGYGRTWNGGELGHGAWATNDNFGTDQFWFVEDCGFKRIVADGRAYTTIDGYAGWRYVARYCNLTNVTFEGHGPETSAGRGTRAAEIYMCREVINGGAVSGLFSYIRSGVQLIWSNTLDGVLGTTPFALPYFRTSELTAGWLGADGTNNWDQNDLAGAPFATGTVAATNGWTIRVADSPWARNQWQHYTLRKTSDVGALKNNDWSIISSSTANGITYVPGQRDPMRFSPGDTFGIFRVRQALDQPGLGRGSLQTGLKPTWATNDQVISPCYEWGNTNTSGVNMNWGIAPFSLTVIDGIHTKTDTVKPGYAPYPYPHPITIALP